MEPLILLLEMSLKTKQQIRTNKINKEEDLMALNTYNVSKFPILESSIAIKPLISFEDRFLRQKNS